MKKAVIYARYSSDSQTEQSIEGQLRVCEDYAKRNDMIIVSNYIDRAMTGTNDKRPEFKRMLVEANDKEWEFVLVYKLDRFSRNKYESVFHKKHLKDLGIKVVSATEAIPDTPEGIILESLLEGMNQYYSAELSQKVKRGMRETRLKGNFQGGLRPYGYDVVNRKLVVNEKEAKVVHYIFNKCILGLTIVQIAENLNKKKIKNRNIPFNAASVSKILNKEYYTGLYEFGGEYYSNIYPPIIPRKIFEKANKRRILNRNPSKKNPLCIYRQKIFCKKCGNKFISDAGTSKTGEVKLYYKCSGRKKLKACNAKAYHKEFLEDYITSYLRKYISNEKKLFNLSQILIKRYKDNRDIDPLKDLEKEKKKKEREINRLISILENGIVKAGLKYELEEAESELARINSEISLEKSKPGVKHTTPFITKHYLNALKLNPTMFATFMVKKILIDKETMDIYLETPYDDAFKDCELVSTQNCKKTYAMKQTKVIYEKKISIYV